MKKLIVGVLATFSMNLLAVDVSYNITCGSLGTENDANTVCGQLSNELKDTVSEDLPEVSIGDYGTGLANANGFAQKGLGSDYSDKFTYFMVRGGAGAAVDGDIDEPEKADGVGIGAAVTVGLNLDLLPIDKVGPVELNKLDIFVSFMNYNVDQEDGDYTTEGELSSFGVMARYQILEGKDIFPGHMLEWGGVFVHTGFQRSSFKADLTSTFDDKELDVGSGNTATFGSSSASFSLDTTTTTIPIEVSTYLRTLWALTFYTGAGFDLVSGTTDVDLDASGTITGNGSASDFNATISADDSDSGEADATNFRAFLGAQVNLPFFRIYAHANKGLGNDLLGVNIGAKILW